MYYADHPPPHFHVSFQEAEAVLRIDNLDVVRGTLPGRALALVVEWALAHHQELRQNWARAARGEPVSAIAPLE